jgi:hypothetical protein
LELNISPSGSHSCQLDCLIRKLIIPVIFIIPLFTTRLAPSGATVRAAMLVNRTERPRRKSYVLIPLWPMSKKNHNPIFASISAAPALLATPWMNHARLSPRAFYSRISKDSWRRGWFFIALSLNVFHFSRIEIRPSGKCYA